MRKTLKGRLPQSVWSIARKGYLSIRNLPEAISAYSHPWRRESMARLKSLKNKYKGERCFVIGNGPSLRQTDISKLKNEITFGMNRVYLAFEEWGFKTTFLVSVNDLVIEQCVDDFLNLNLPLFFSWRSRNFFPSSLPREKMPIFLFTTYEDPKFARDARFRLWEGATVTYVCLQLAFHMGFDQVILVGIDHSFQTTGEANKTVVSEGDDPNHFLPNYFGKGFRWQLPDLQTSELAYRMARLTYEQAGRKIVDATIGGKLTVFPKVSYDALF
jgi:hypothetical protein